MDRQPPQIVREVLATFLSDEPVTFEQYCEFTAAVNWHDSTRRMRTGTEIRMDAVIWICENCL